MCIEIGDKVAVLNDVLKGVVVAKNDTIITFEDADGMQFAFQKNELVKIAIDQNELTKYSDIDHPLFKAKKTLKTEQKIESKSNKNSVIMEVDLHINQLVKSTRNMDNFDMLTLQLETAKKKLEFCIEKRISKLIFIHGVGAGVLKTELEYLFNKYPVKYYNASYQKYGLGATEVYIFQNSK